MVQSKHHKSKPKPKPKPKNKPHVKKQGKQTDISQFRSHLEALGLKIVELTSDGNCFFRALADQLEGNEELHLKYRHMVVDYILKHREYFEPFLEDDVQFDEYCVSMEKDGTWAGHMELQAASLVTHCNICIHRIMSPRWYIRNFDNRAAHMIHLSYHNGEHYNSVRSKEDPCNGPAKLIVIKADADLSATSHKGKGVANSKEAPCKNSTDTGSIKLVMVGSGCQDIDKVSQVLQLFEGNVDAATEFLIEEQGAEDLAEYDEPFTLLMDGHNEKGECERPLEAPRENTSRHSGPCSSAIKATDNDTSSCPIDKTIPRNKVCPCGSKKKHKACCGSIKGTPSTESVMSPKVASGKGRKERKQGKKGGSTKISPSGGFDSELPDMGALCI